MTEQCNYLSRYLSGVAVVFLSLMMLNMEATAKDGQEIYDETCLLCHGPITEPSALHPLLPGDGSGLQLAVITPKGPTLNGIVGRPAAIISNYAYSKAMRKFGESGAVWDRETLDLFLTDSRKFVKGTFMILKLEEEDRKQILDYLESIAIYRL